MEIAKLSEKYIDQIADIEADCFSTEAWTHASIKSALTNKLCCFEILIDKGIVIGYYSFYNSGNEAYVNNIAVRLACRGNGFGKVLLDRLIDQAKSIGCKAITLEVRKSNVIAQKIYEKADFKLEGIRPRFYSDNEDALIYWYKTED